jgi:predicted secreted protein
VDAKSAKALTLDEALAEPIVRAMMAADGLREEDVRAQLVAAATRLRAQD